MPQQLLYIPYIGAILEQMCRETIPSQRFTCSIRKGIFGQRNIIQRLSATYTSNSITVFWLSIICETSQYSSGNKIPASSNASTLIFVFTCLKTKYALWLLFQKTPLISISFCESPSRYKTSSIQYLPRLPLKTILLLYSGSAPLCSTGRTPSVFGGGAVYLIMHCCLA